MSKDQAIKSQLIIPKLIPKMKDNYCLNSLIDKNNVNFRMNLFQFTLVIKQHFVQKLCIFCLPEVSGYIKGRSKYLTLIPVDEKTFIKKSK